MPDWGPFDVSGTSVVVTGAGARSLIRKEEQMDAQDTIARTQDALNAKIAFGEPYEKNGITVIPAASVRGGAGGGTGEGPEGTGRGTGSGFGFGARPAGAYVIEETPAFRAWASAVLASASPQRRARSASPSTSGPVVPST